MKDDKHRLTPRLPDNYFDNLRKHFDPEHPEHPNNDSSEAFKKEPAALKLSRLLQAKDRDHLILYYDVAGEQVKGDIYAILKNPKALASLLITEARKSREISEALNLIVMYVQHEKTLILDWADASQQRKQRKPKK